MIVSDSCPMVAAISRGSVACSCSWERDDRKRSWAGRGWKRGETKSTTLLGRSKDAERRALKRAERREVSIMVVEVIDFEAPVITTPRLGVFHADDCGGFYT